MFNSFMLGIAGGLLKFVGFIVFGLGLIALCFGGDGAAIYLIGGPVIVFGGAYMGYLSKQTVKTR